MQVLDRKTAPSMQEINSLAITFPKKNTLSNGIPVYSIEAGSQEVVEISFYFTAGNWYQLKKLQSKMACEMIPEGTPKLTAHQIAEKIDFYGAFLQCENGYNRTSVTLFTLNKYLDNTLPIVLDVLFNATFPQQEFDVKLKNAHQSFKINSAKNNFLARMHFNEGLFGKEHPFGKCLENSDYTNLSHAETFDYYKNKYTVENCTIILAGNGTAVALEKIDKLIGKLFFDGSKVTPRGDFSIQSSSENCFVERPDSIQNAIRIGKITIDNSHEDYFNLQILNTVLGGYFGSRLMANIREDKGYTYGIGSSMVTLKGIGYFVLSTEVGSDVSSLALNEIYKEMERLTEEEIAEDELKLVKNYLLGQELRSADGPFALSDKLSGVLLNNLSEDYFDRKVKAIKTCTTANLKELAHQYLQPESMLEIVVGKK